MKINQHTAKRTDKIIYIGQISVYFGLLILSLRHYWVSPATHFPLVALIMVIGFLPSYLLRGHFQRYTSYILVANALILASFIFTLLREWELGGVFILIPVFSLLFRDRHIYLSASLSSFVINILLIFMYLFEPEKEKQQMVAMLDLLTIYIITVFLIYFIVKDLVWNSTLEAKHMQTILTLSKSVEVKDKYTQGHSDRVAFLGELIADRIPGIPAKAAFYSGLIHDVGKLSIPDTILLKNSSLTDEEYDIMKKHTTVGASICNSLDISQDIILGVKHHHERWNGQGYPSALEAKQIPLLGRILCIADSIDAMSSDRAYRKARDSDWIRKEVEQGSGSQFDPEIVRIVLDDWDEIEQWIKKKAV